MPHYDFSLGKNPSKKLAWITDIHLDFVEPAQFEKFVQEIKESRPDMVLVGGDISNAPNLVYHLKMLINAVNIPFYFVLGNHDYYYGSIEKVRSMIKNITAKDDRLHFLTEGEAYQLTEDTALIGHDGWADGQEGDFIHSNIMLNDYLMIADLVDMSTLKRKEKLRELGIQAADKVRGTLTKALKSARQVIFLTHVPPFLEACVHKGELSDMNWSPHFVCKAMGEAILECLNAYEDRKLIVFCGHTHSPVEVWLRPNLQVIAGESKYGFPKVQATMDV